MPRPRTARLVGVLALCVALLAGLLGAAAGCDLPSEVVSGPPSPTGQPSPSPGVSGGDILTASDEPEPVPTEPASALRDAAARVAGQNIRFTLGNGVDRADGVIEGATGAASLSRIIDGHRVQVDVFGSELYLAGFLPADRIMRVDATRLPDGHELLPVASPLLALRLFTGLTEVKAARHGRYSGLIDLTAVRTALDEAGPYQPQGTEVRLVNYLAAQAGDRAGRVEFTAIVDGAGRLAQVQIVIPRADSGRDFTYELVVGQVGVTIGVPRPGGPAVVDAPASFYLP